MIFIFNFQMEFFTLSDDERYLKIGSNSLNIIIKNFARRGPHVINFT